jgi:hypothetical protein
MNNALARAAHTKKGSQSPHIEDSGSGALLPSVANLAAPKHVQPPIVVDLIPAAPPAVDLVFLAIDRPDQI